MNVIGLVGSPRKESNTDLLIDAILKGAQDHGASTQKIYIYPQTIQPCIDCRACKHDNYQCILKDDMQILYPKLEAADVLVFGTPLYWYGPSAKMKLLIDRLRPYVESKKLQGKRAVLVVPSAEGAQACKPVLDMFSLSLKYLDVPLVGALFPSVYERAEIKNNSEVLKQAYALGKKLAVS